MKGFCQFVDAVGGVSAVGAVSFHSEELAVGNAVLLVFGVTGVVVQVCVGICWFVVAFGLDTVVGKLNTLGGRVQPRWGPI